MTTPSPTPEQLMEMCKAEIAAHEICGGCDQFTIATALLKRLERDKHGYRRVIRTLRAMKP